DDGPNKEYTEKLLDGLKARDVKASFFLVGECITGNEETVKRMDEEGHLIGVHCMEHTDLTKSPLSDALKCLSETADMVEEITGKQPDYVRPPYGSWNDILDESVTAELSMVPVFWSVDSTDWKLKNTSKIVNKVMKETKDGDIILMHDEFSTSVEAAFQIIDNLLAKGYTFVTVNELTID
ncbi:MAG: polysaccharide deacetylase family protein, partial [Firmicutes bacterium]|nr:polysaccharide deacetylase family protein [Bacillota bacterium]